MDQMHLLPLSEIHDIVNCQELGCCMHLKEDAYIIYGRNVLTGKSGGGEWLIRSLFLWCTSSLFPENLKAQYRSIILFTFTYFVILFFKFNANFCIQRVSLYTGKNLLG